jgi:hypothetical protein
LLTASPAAAPTGRRKRATRDPIGSVEGEWVRDESTM